MRAVGTCWCAGFPLPMLLSLTVWCTHVDVCVAASALLPADRLDCSQIDANAWDPLVMLPNCDVSSNNSKAPESITQEVCIRAQVWCTGSFARNEAYAVQPLIGWMYMVFCRT